MADPNGTYELMLEAYENLPEYTFDDANIITIAKWVDKFEGRFANPHLICSACEESALYRPYRDELGKLHYEQERSARCHGCGAYMLNKRFIFDESDDQKLRSFTCSVPIENKRRNDDG